MKQTANYKLNLIENDDTFSPTPLNENMQKLDSTLAAETSTRQSGINDLTQRVTTLEGHKIAYGTYSGTGSTQSINVGFAPIAVIVVVGLQGASLLIPDTVGYQFLTSNGFMVSNSSNINVSGKSYSYVAFC